MDATLILALMLLVFPPGKSLYSVIEVEEGSPLVALRAIDMGDGASATAYGFTPAGEADPPQCSDPLNVACRRPVWRAHLKSFGRVESFAEGLQRYWTIAGELAAAAPDRGDVLFSLAVTYDESGWRRDVHAGHNHRPFQPSTTQEDSGKSWCLGQIMVGKKPGTKVAGTDWRARQLVGVDAEATRRCLDLVVKNVQRSRRYCRTHGGGGDACVFTTYGGGAAPAKALRSRTKMMEKLRAASPHLSDVIRAELGLEPNGDAPAS